MATHKTDALVIGAGPGGYVAAIRLGQLGVKTMLVEKEYFGGVCLNVGCIPSKALITAAKQVEKTRSAADIGIEVGEVKIDYAKTQKWKQGISDKLSGGVKFLLENNGVTILEGEAKFKTPNKVEVKTKDGVDSIEASNTIVATGSRSVEIPGFEYDGKLVLSSTHALALSKIPKKLVVIGGGYIGLELGMMFQKLGTEVAVVEMMDQVLPGFDADVVKQLSRNLKKKKIAVHLETKALGYEKKKGGVAVRIEKGGKESTLEADHVLVTVGRRPNSENLGLEDIGVQIERGFIQVNEKLQTNVPGVYAIGDVVGNPMLAHKASKEGEVAAEVIAGKPTVFDVRAIPAVVFTDPEIAAVGLSEAEAKEQGYDVEVGKYGFAAHGRAMTTRETDGFIKVIGDRKTHDLLGVTIIGPEASDLIAEAALALEMGASVEDIALTIHAHPTLGEAMMEASKGALGEAIHALNK